MNIIAAIFLILGFIFILIAAIGVLRLPDFYSRLHASGASETMGIILFCLGLILYTGWTLDSVKLLFIVLFAFLANPTGTHAISRAAFKAGLKPWMGKEE